MKDTTVYVVLESNGVVRGVYTTARKALSIRERLQRRVMTKGHQIDVVPMQLNQFWEGPHNETTNKETGA